MCVVTGLVFMIYVWDAKDIDDCLGLGACERACLVDSYEVRDRCLVKKEKKMVSLQWKLKRKNAVN